MALTRPGSSNYDFGQEGFGGGIPMKNVVLSTLLYIDNELDGNGRVIGLSWIGCLLVVTNEVARILRGH
jgi:hypothetical protein